MQEGKLRKLALVFPHKSTSEIETPSPNNTNSMTNDVALRNSWSLIGTDGDVVS
jgi:hypothetical protein